MVPNLNLKTSGVLTISAAAILAMYNLIMPWEGVKYVPYYDIGGVLTVCYGHTGPDIIKNKKYTKQECINLLKADLVRFDRAVDRCIQTDLPKNTKAAFVSFAFNVGESAMCNSTLAKLANMGNLKGACNQLPRWRYVKGREVRGLFNRRVSERKLCLDGLDVVVS